MSGELYVAPVDIIAKFTCLTPGFIVLSGLITVDQAQNRYVPCVVYLAADRLYSTVFQLWSDHGTGPAQDTPWLLLLVHVVVLL